MVKRRHLAGRGKSTSRPCVVCLRLYATSLSRGSAVHTSAAACEKWMLAHVGRGCSAPSEHHEYETAPIRIARDR
jgi:hypothetical protein